MKIVGFVPNSFVDYKENIASVIFSGGCNFNCEYCHNAEMLHSEGIFEIAEILEKIRKRRDFIDGVVISGGEPTLAPLKSLERLVRSIKDMGLKVKLDTNGTNPDKLLALIDDIDYIAMDIKAPLEKYALVTQISNLDIPNIEKSIEIVKGHSGEFRTTVIIEHTLGDIEEMAKSISGGNANYYLQRVNQTSTYKKPRPDSAFFDEALRIANKYLPTFLR